MNAFWNKRLRGGDYGASFKRYRGEPNQYSSWGLINKQYFLLSIHNLEPLILLRVSGADPS